MKSLIKTAKTVEEAINEALKELSLEREDVSIEVLDEPSKGLFGLIGSKDARVRITATNDPEEIAKNFLNKLFSKMNILADINISRDKSNLYIDIVGVNEVDMGILIGKRGNTLDSVQYILSLIVNKDRQNYVRVLLDTENYRKKREETLIRLAGKMADKARGLRRSIRLEPMNPYERRIIHAALQNHPYVETHSEGEEPYRRVVINLK